MSSVYLTTASPGREANSNLSAGLNGIEYWQSVARGAEPGPLRKLLQESQIDENVLRFVRDADDEVLVKRLI